MIFRPQAGKSWRCFRLWREVCAAIIWILFTIQILAEHLQTAPKAIAASIDGSFPQSTAAQTGAGMAATPDPTLAISSLADLTNPVVPMPAATSAAPVKLVTNQLPANLVDFFAATNGLPRKSMSQDELLVHLTRCLEMARYLRNTRQPEEAEPLLLEALDERSPELLKQSALLELAAVSQDENKLPRAQQIYAQFLGKWPNDMRVPEILLRQGILFRQMGMYNLSFSKFYAVMTSALVLKNDQLDYYVRLVLQAQTEIADTQYELGKYTEAADFFSRLLKQNNSSVNKPQITYKLVRCNIALRKYGESVAGAQDFLGRFPEAPERPEIRFYLAQALKQLGRNNESLQQVLLLLQEQRILTKARPALWSYWQQRAGNLIANQFYQEGDYSKALEIYLNLAQLDRSPQWQVPISYQIGMTYERLWQPQKATETYTAILTHEKGLGANVPPDLKTVFDMARWRLDFIQWQAKAEASNRELHFAAPTNSATTASLSGSAVSVP